MPPEEVSAMVLERLKKYAEDFIGEEVTDAVVTVPACDHFLLPITPLPPRALSMLCYSIISRSFSSPSLSLSLSVSDT